MNRGRNGVGLSAEQVQAIRQAWPMSVAERSRWADEYGVSRKTIYNAATRKGAYAEPRRIRDRG